MSRGPGKIRRMIHDLFVRLGWLDRSHTVTDLCREIYGTNKPTEAQRASALRAAHVAGAGRIQPTNSQSSPTPAE
jgi:hypothetical protein